MRFDWKSFKYVLVLFLIWRIGLLLIAYFGLSALPTFDFYNKHLFLPGEQTNFWQRWGNWDGGGYLYITQNGYIPRLTVFFPAYSLLIKLLSLIGLTFFTSALALSHIFALISFYFFFKLAKLEFDETIAKKALFYLLIFPASFYLVTIYNESLFLASALGAFYFSHKKNWLLAALFASLSVATKLIGIAVVAGVIWEYLNLPKPNLSFLRQSFLGRIFIYLILIWLVLNTLLILPSITKSPFISGVLVSLVQILEISALILLWVFLLKWLHSVLKKDIFKKILSKNALFLVLSALPLPAYLIYQQQSFGSFKTFVSQESAWGRMLSYPWQGPLYALKYVLFNPLGMGEFSSHIHFRLLIFIFVLTGLIFCYKRLKFFYTLFFLISFLIPLFSGTIADIARYSLVIFPLFFVLATIKNDYFEKTYTFVSLALLTLFTILFINGYFFI